MTQTNQTPTNKVNTVNKATTKNLYEMLDQMTYILANTISATVDGDYAMTEAMAELSRAEYDEMTREELIDTLNLNKDATDEEIEDAKSESELDGWTVYQTYHVNEYTHEILKDYGQLTWYNEELDAYFWGVTHYGTAWSHVMGSVYPKPEEAQHYQK